jgi:hypothetical protein
LSLFALHVMMSPQRTACDSGSDLYQGAVLSLICISPDCEQDIMSIIQKPHLLHVERRKALPIRIAGCSKGQDWSFLCKQNNPVIQRSGG